MFIQEEFIFMLIREAIVAKINSSPIISYVLIVVEMFVNCENKIPWINSDRQPLENKLLRKISVFQYVYMYKTQAGCMKKKNSFPETKISEILDWLLRSFQIY